MHIARTRVSSRRGGVGSSGGGGGRNTRSHLQGCSQLRGNSTAPHHRSKGGTPPLLCAHQHGDDIPGGTGPAPGGRDGARLLAAALPSPPSRRDPRQCRRGCRGGGTEPPGCGVSARAGAVAARPGSKGGSRDFLLEEAALWQLPVGDGGGGWGKGPPAFMETRWRGAGSAGAGGRQAGAPPFPTSWIQPQERQHRQMHGDRVLSQRPAAPRSPPARESQPGKQLPWDCQGTGKWLWKLG